MGGLPETYCRHFPAFRGMAAFLRARDDQSLYYVIPSVAEESEMPALESISRFLDSSATLGMT